jgi:hypothetical protein
MAGQNRETLEIILGVVMAQSAILDFLIKNKVIESGPLIEHLAGRRTSWEKTATANALFSIDVLLSLLAGKQPPPAPGSLH